MQGRLLSRLRCDVAKPIRGVSHVSSGARFGFLLCLVACAARPPNEPADAKVIRAGVPPTTENLAHLPTHPIPEDLRAKVAMSARLGEALFEQDEVSARATDALLARVPQEQVGVVRGWLTLPGPWWNVAFVVASGSSVKVGFEVTLPQGEPPIAAKAGVARVEPPRELSLDEQSRWRAFRSASAVYRGECGPRANPVILPASLADQSGWLVYLLASTEKPGTAVWGGHQFFHVSADGSQVLAQHRLSRCDIVSVPKGTVANVMQTPFFDAPNEGHVFSALSNRMDFYIGTPRGLWQVHGAHIEFKGNQAP